MDDAKELKKVGDAIRRFRMELEVSQDAFADRIDMHRAYYGTIERGRQNVTVLTLLRICEGLGVKPSEVLAQAEL
ncbi:helix-turn-helix transcriptional regulator [Luteimonas sp. MJ204]|uniref:helix-turn-helix domain-containing protein n=1 Tax=Luteimonas sp. MJ145 TaxID=3129234 RepID=UPI0031BBC2C4